jgi:hypothetical protein
MSALSKVEMSVSAPFLEGPSSARPITIRRSSFPALAAAALHALRQAWAEAREAARIAAIPPAVKAERIETLHALVTCANYIDCGPQWSATVRAHRDEILQLQGA